MEDPSQIISFITGAGGASAVMWFWNRSLQEQIKELNNQLKDERDRVNEFGEAIVAIATETKIHLSESGKSCSEIKSLVSSEHEKTRTEIRIRKDEGKE